MCVCMSVCVCVYKCEPRILSVKLSKRHMCVYMSVCVYIYKCEPRRLSVQLASLRHTGVMCIHI